MPSRLKVVVTEPAREDLNEIARYIVHRDSRASARKQMVKLRDRIRALSTTAARGRFPPELEERGIRSWRELVVDPWRIIYQIDGRLVTVLVVVDGRRDLSEALLRRLTRA